MNPWPRAKSFLAGAALFLGAVLLFWPATRVDWYWLDDRGYFTENAVVRAGPGLEGWRLAWTEEHNGNWHPLTWLSLALDAKLFHREPAPVRAGNVLLHGLAGALLFAALAALTGAPGLSLLAAALWTAHPQRVESVAWLAERKDVLSGVFWAAGLGAYARHARAPSAGRLAWVGLFQALALLSKPSAVTFPCVLLLLDAWPLRRAEGASWRALAAEKAPLFVLSAASAWATVWAMTSGLVSTEALPLWARAAHAPVALVAYVRQTFWPTGLSAFYPHPGRDLPLAAAAAAAVSVLSGFAAAFLLRKRAPQCWVGACWFAGVLVPMLGFTQVYAQGRADRFTYLAQTGLWLAAVWTAAQLTSGRPALRRAALGLGVLAVGAFTVLSRRQLAHWASERTLVEQALAHGGPSALMASRMARIEMEAGDPGAAEGYFEQAALLNPADGDAALNLAVFALGRGDLKKAEEELERARRAGASRASLLNARGLALSHAGRLEEAAQSLREAAELDPSRVSTQNNLAGVLARLGRTDEAARRYEAVLDADPSSPDAYNNLGILRAMQGRPEEAARLFKEALRRRPRFAAAQENLRQLETAPPGARTVLKQSLELRK